MEENFRPTEPPALPDLAAAQSCRNELTRSDSDSSSITADNSKDFFHRDANDTTQVAWTNEKHNSYLDALEASFVKQLHHSLGLFSNHSEESTCDSSPSKKLPVDTSNISDLFTVLQEGSAQKINPERNHASGPHAVTESPLMCHFTSSGKQNTMASADSEECNMFHGDGMPLRGKRIFSHRFPRFGQKCMCYKSHHDAVGNIAEVSDQNFVDEEREETSSNRSPAKRLKVAADDTSTKDQIAPSGELFKCGSFNDQ